MNAARRQSPCRFYLWGCFFLLLLLSAAGALVQYLERKAFEQEAYHRVKVLTQMGKAIRAYCKNTLRPAVQAHTDQFILEAMSSTYVTQGVFREFNRTMPLYHYRQAVLNPLNPANRADEEEQKWIEMFQKNPDLEMLSGHRELQGRQVFFVARPIIVERRCLRCHGSPQTAPAELVARYGTQSGYGWQPGQVAGVLLVAAPTEDLMAQYASMRYVVWGVFVAVGVVLFCGGVVAYRRLLAINVLLERARQKADQANRAKSTFLANMSHEIRTPLTAILGFAEELWLKLKAQNASPEQLHYLQIIRRNGQHLLALINDILDLSKIEAEKLELEILPCSPAQILADVASAVAVRAKQKGLKFRVDIQGRVPRTISTDPTRVHQLLLNLAGNAVKFTEKGSVELLLRMEQKPDGQAALVFQVRDTGIGMDAQTLKKLFHPFVQADASTTRRFGGTGLGLVISQRLAQQLGGEIHVESTPGQGSCFTFVLPIGKLEPHTPLVGSEALRQHDDPNDGSPPRPIQLQGVRVLLAEDGPDNQLLIRTLLEKAGAQVLLAQDGEEVLQKVEHLLQQGTPPHVILMDMQMPKLDGVQATRLLRQQGYQGPIVALTANAMHQDRERCLQAGCNDFLTKPIQRQKLLQTVAHWAAQAQEKLNSPAST